MEGKIRDGGEQTLSTGFITYQGIIDELFQLTVSGVIVTSMAGGHFKKYMIPVFLTPIIIDSDHFLPEYGDGIKAFHSIAFISMIALPFLIYGLIKMEKSAIFSGASIYVMGIMNVSIDLLEGGKICFGYPIYRTSYVLSTHPSPAISSAGIFLMLILLLSLLYIMRSYLWPSKDELKNKRKDFYGDRPHHYPPLQPILPLP